MKNLLDTLRENILWVIVVFVVSVVLATLAWQYYHTEKITRVKFTLNERAKINPFYASELLLNAQNNDYRPKNSTSKAPPSKEKNQRAISQQDMDLMALIANLPKIKEQNPTLIIRQLGTTVTEKKADELLTWVEQGGHLITFSHRSAEVGKKDWQKVDNRLMAIKKQLKLNKNQPIKNYNQAFANAIQNDKDLQQALEEIYQDNNEIFWHKLGVYLVENDNEKSQEKLNKTLKKELDKLVPKKEKNELNKQARRYIEKLAYKNNKELIINNRQNQQLMVNADDNNYLYDELLLATHPQAKVRNEFSLANAQQIRQYFTNQLIKIDKFLAKLTKVKKETNDFKKNLLERKSVLQLLLKLSDSTLQKLFSPLNQVMIDVDYGKGRITLLKSAEIFDNPNASKVEIVHREKELLEKGIVPQNILNDWGFMPNSALYSQDHAQLLTDLTTNSDKIWLFPNIDIDPLPVMLWKKARFAILGLALLIFVWLWSLHNRFGKRQYLENSQSVDIFYYFQQIGRYGWDYDNGKLLSQTSRKQVQKLVQQALNLKVNSQFNQKDILQLSQLLQEKFRQKLAMKKDNDDLLNTLQANEQEISQLLQIDRLTEVLFISNEGLESITPHEFTEYTQVLWLVKWLLK
ncbi:MAG: hypothetical protein KGV51_08795 [Moraxellaceae bacterium]|nr:hypothetical protein [Moraxellaceae bacterium]